MAQSFKGRELALRLTNGTTMENQWAYGLKPSRWTMGAIAGGPLGGLEAGRAPFFDYGACLSTGSATEETIFFFFLKMSCEKQVFNPIKVC